MHGSSLDIAARSHKAYQPRMSLSNLFFFCSLFLHMFTNICLKATIILVVTWNHDCLQCLYVMWSGALCYRVWVLIVLPVPTACCCWDKGIWTDRGILLLGQAVPQYAGEKKETQKGPRRKAGEKMDRRGTQWVDLRSWASPRNSCYFEPRLYSACQRVWGQDPDCTELSKGDSTAEIQEAQSIAPLFAAQVLIELKDS